MKTVLVVDDDDMIRKLVCEALEARDNWTVLEAVDGVDGVARFLLFRPEIIVTDLSMPRSDGFEMLDVLRKGGHLEGVKVVIMSGIINVQAINARNAGNAVLLSKPFTLQELYTAVGD